MINKGRNMRYRRSIYRKNGIHVYLLVAAAVLTAVVLLFVILGNALGNKAEKSESERNSNKSTESASNEHPIPRNVSAYPVPLSAEDSRLDSRISNAVSLGYADVCFDLDTENDTLLYMSDVAISLGYLSSDSELWKLENAVNLFDRHGLYTIGITHLSRMDTENDLDRQIAAGYYTARIAEAFRSGVDDVLIHSEELSTALHGELTEIANDVHRLCPDATIGISVTPQMLSGEDGGALVDLLWESFDYIAISLDHQPNEGETIPQMADRELGGMLYYLLRYNMRVLIPSTDTDTIAQTKTVLVENGVQNMLVLP